MSTRGAVGIICNGIEKVGYNHCDSYPEGLGNEMIEFLKHMNNVRLKEIFDKISFNEDSKPMDVWNWKKHTFNENFADSSDFLADSLFCEWAYIINLDTKMLEFYQGFNNDEKANGRYANKGKYECSNGTVYYGVSLKKEIPLISFYHGKMKIVDDNFEEK